MGGISLNRFVRVSSGSGEYASFGVGKLAWGYGPGGAFGTLLGPEATGSVVSGFSCACRRPAGGSPCGVPGLVDGCDGVVV